MCSGFWRGRATWLAIPLLKYSNYKYEKGTDGKYKGIEIVGDSIDAQILGVYGYNQVVQGTDRNLDLNYEAGLINCYGEDAELAITKLLWRVTNDIPLSGTSYMINKLIHFNKLFNNVFLDGKGKGRGLKNIKDFYHALFNYYVKTTPELVGGQYWNSSRFEENFGNDGDKKAYYQMDNIEKLAGLFATFGMAPAIEPNNFELTKHDGNIGDSITWYDRSTGTMPRDEAFDIYVCYCGDSLSHRTRIESNNVIKGETTTKGTVSYKEENGQLIYKYILTDADKAFITNSYAHSSPHMDLFFTFMVRTSTEARSYFSDQIWLYIDWWWAEMFPYTHKCDARCSQ